MRRNKAQLKWRNKSHGEIIYDVHTMADTVIYLFDTSWCPRSKIKLLLNSVLTINSNSLRYFHCFFVLADGENDDSRGTSVRRLLASAPCPTTGHG
jgi:hypothetical protein